MLRRHPLYRCHHGPSEKSRGAQLQPQRGCVYQGKKTGEIGVVVQIKIQNKRLQKRVGDEAAQQGSKVKSHSERSEKSIKSLPDALGRCPNECEDGGFR